MSKDICSICLDELNNDQYKLNCNHCYHKNCIKQWLRNNEICPLCRTRVDPDLRYVEDDILLEATRLRIDSAIKASTIISKSMEYFIPSMQGYTDELHNFMTSDTGTFLLRKIGENVDSLDLEIKYNNLINIINNLF